MKNFPNEMIVCITESGKLSGTKLGCLWTIDKRLSNVDGIKRTLLETGFIDEVTGIVKIKDSIYKVSYLDNMIYSVDGENYAKKVQQ